jgi:hypothetical protein
LGTISFGKTSKGVDERISTLMDELGDKIDKKTQEVKQEGKAEITLQSSSTTLRRTRRSNSCTRSTDYLS